MRGQLIAATALAIATLAATVPAGAGGCAGKTAEAVEACIQAAREAGVEAVDALLRDAGFSRTAEMEPNTAHFIREGGFMRGPSIMAVLVTDGDRVVRVAVR